MMERKSGRIINFGSIAGLGGGEVGVIYASAKAAVHEYTRCIAVQLRPFDVMVNAIAPGAIITNRILASRDMEDSKMVKSGTQDRYGWPIEIARAVEFLVSGNNTYITGQVLRVDGGLQTWPA